MPFDANGNFSLVPGTIVSDGMTIQPSQHNPPFQDVANGLSQVVLRSGVAPMTGPLNMNGNKVSGVASGDQPGDVVTRADISDMAVAIGDGAWSVRDLGSNWLRRDGALYPRTAYPELAPLMPPLPDGILWETRTSGTPDAIEDAIYAEGRYIAVSRRAVISSPDGRVWSVRSDLSEMGDYHLIGIAYGLNIYIAVDVNEGRTLRSPDGDTWAASSVVSAQGIFSITFSETLGLFIAVGGGGYIGTSDDGATWTQRTSNYSGFFQSVEAFDNLIIATGNNGTIRTSSDGINWSTRVSGVNETLRGGAYHDGLYIIVGNGGTILTSEDGASWISRSSGTSLDLRAAAGGSTGFLVAGMSGVVRISPNGTSSWTAAPTGIAGTFNAALVDPNDGARYLLLGPSQTVLDGIRTQPTQFRVPNDDPTYGWIRAK